MVHPDVINVTKENILQGYLVYLGPVQTWNAIKSSWSDSETIWKDSDGLSRKISPFKQVNINGSPIEETEEQFKLDLRPNAGYIPSEVTVPKVVEMLEPNRKSPVIYTPLNLTLAETNRHLIEGFYEPSSQITDIRLGTGETIIIYKLDKNGITSILRVESTAYNWRSNNRDRNPNLLHQFYRLCNNIYINTLTGKGLNLYRSRFPIIPQWDIESITESVNTQPIIVWPKGPINDAMIQTREQRFYNIWACFLMTVPLHRQIEVVSMYQHFLSKRRQLVSFAIELEDSGDLDNADLSDRLKTMIIESRDYAQDIIKNTRESNTRQDLPTLTHENIKKLVNREETTSLYRLVKNMDSYKRLMDEKTLENTQYQVSSIIPAVSSSSTFTPVILPATISSK